MVNNETRTCKDCKSIKPLIEFRVCKVNPKTGTKTIDTKCIPCRRLTQINYNKTAQYYKPKEVKSKPGRKPKPVELVKPVETYSEPKPKKYLSNKHLYYELVVSKAQGRLTHRCSNMLYLLGKNVIRKFSYTNPQDKDDSFQEGMFQVYKNWFSFDETITDNAFAYMTEVFKRGVAAGFNKVHQKKGDEYLSKRNVSMSGYGEDGDRELNI